MCIYFDLETTGLNQFHDKITDLCFIKESDNSQYQTLVNPEKNISNFITRLTGISNEMVQDKPTFEQLYPNILTFINDSPETKYLIAHNGDGFDKIILRVHLKKVGVDTSQFDWKCIDTLLLAKKLYPYIFKHNLKNLMTVFNLTVRDAHRAEADTLMLRDLYRHLCLDLAKKEKVEYQYVLDNPGFVWSYINE